jgi:predicted nuclease with TOPRIM domain
MFGLPMEIVGPVVGIGSLILIVAAGIVMVRLFTAKIARHEATSRMMDATGRDQMLEDVRVRLGELDQLQQRIGELEERVDFAERLLSARHQQQQLGPSPDAS